MSPAFLQPVAPLFIPVSPQFDSVGTGVDYATAGGPWSHTITGNLTLVLEVSYRQASSSSGYPGTPSAPGVSATVGGSAATLISQTYLGITHVYVSPLYYTRGWYLSLFSIDDPPTGSQSVSCTSSSGSVPNRITATSISYSGVSLIGAPITASGNTISIPSSSPNIRYVGVFASPSTGFSTFNQSERWNDVYLDIGDAVGNGDTLTFSVTESGVAAVVPLLA